MVTEPQPDEGTASRCGVALRLLVDCFAWLGPFHAQNVVAGLDGVNGCTGVSFVGQPSPQANQRRVAWHLIA